MSTVVVPLGNENVWFAGRVNVPVGSVVIVTLISVVRAGTVTAPPCVTVSEPALKSVRLKRSIVLPVFSLSTAIDPVSWVTNGSSTSPPESASIDVLSYPAVHGDRGELGQRQDAVCARRLERT